MSDNAAAPPSRTLLAVTIALVAGLTILRVIAAATLDLRTDEAYYWTWSRQLVLSYLDQPPMVAWVERLGIAIFGDTPLGVRFGQLLVLPLIELILADIARRSTRSWNAALFVVVAMECTLNYGFFSIVVEPNLPLLLFVSALFWAALKLETTGDPRWWLAIGGALGLALLSKFLVVLLLPGLALYALMSGPARKSLATPWPYAGAALALLVFSPVIAWNARHGWAGLLFQGTRLGGSGESQLPRYIVYEALWVGPVLIAACLAGTIALLVVGLRRSRPFATALAATVLIVLAYLAWRSLGIQINQSWTWFVWPLGILALALALPWQRAPRAIGALTAAVVVLGLPLPLAFFYHASFDRAVWFGIGDPFGQDAGFDTAGRRLLTVAEANGVRWIATTEYRIYAALDWQIGNDIPVVMVTQRARFLDFATAAPPSGRALYVHEGEVDPLLASAALTPLKPVPATWRGTPMRKLQVDLLDGYAVELTPPPESPFYAAVPQP